MFTTDTTISTAVFWMAIVAIVFVSTFFSYRERASRNRMIQTLVEKGQPIPPELLEEARRRPGRSRSPFSSGIYLMCIGIAIAVFLWAMSSGVPMFEGERIPNWIPFVGIFPFMIGFARFVSGFLERPREPQEK